MSEFYSLRKKFEPADNEIKTGQHVVIDVSKEENSANRHRSRRISLKTMEWLNGKVESIRQKFANITLEQTSQNSVAKRVPLTRPTNDGQRRISQSDVDLLEMCRKYQLCGENQYTFIAEPFETVVSNYGTIIQEKRVEIHRDRANPPRGILLLPLSPTACESLLDFTEMGGYSLGRGSRVAKKATKSLSRAHCMVYLENNDAFVKDLDSKTGTFVNGRLLGSSQPKLIENYDVVQMGYGAENDDFVQFMLVFLDDWDQVEFESIVQSANHPTSSYSRTFSNSFNNLMLDNHFDGDKRLNEAQKEGLNTSTQCSPLKNVSPTISSPKMTLIKGQQPIKLNDDREDESKIVFEKPEPFEPSSLKLGLKSPREEMKIESPKIQPNVSKSPKYTVDNSAIESETSKIEYSIDNKVILESPKIQQTIAKESPKYKMDISEMKMESPITNQAPLSNLAFKLDSPKTNEDSTFESKHFATPLASATSAKSPLISGGTMRPPVPKPRRTKKNLSKSVECLIELEIDSESRPEADNSGLNSPLKTVKMPIESALSMRKSSVSSPSAAQVVNIAIPEFLRAENLKIPSISPAVQLISTPKPFEQRVARKFSIPVSEKRKERVAKLQKSTQFSTIVQGAAVKRIENFIDFGSASSDIADGYWESFVGSRSSAQARFHNYRIAWYLEFIGEGSGCKYVIEAGERMNQYSLSIEAGKSGDSSKLYRIGQVDFIGKTAAKVTFSIDDPAYKALKGVEIDVKESLPLRALQQLSFFYPHLEVPSLTIQGSPSGPSEKVTISQVCGGETKPLAKLTFEGLKTTWQRRQMNYAIDLNTSEVEIDTIVADVIQSLSVIYCLRYHLD